MDTELIGLLAVAGLLVLMFLRVPIAVALLITGALGYAAAQGWGVALRTLASVPYELTGANPGVAYSFTVVPLFIFMGAVASRANMSGELFDAANAVFSGVRGALAAATIGSCAAFSAICGSSIATAATFSKVAIPQMRRYGYDLELATGAVASAGTLGILIPPSLILVIYSLVAEEPIAKLFAAAMIPGILLALAYVVVIAILAKLHPEKMPLTPSLPWPARLKALVGVWKLALLFLLAVVGIYLGWFSPTEAASVASFAAMVIGVATRSLGWRGIWEAGVETVQTSAMLFFIVIGAFVFSRLIVLTQFPVSLVNLVERWQFSPWMVILAIVALYLLLGTFLEEVSTLLITVPVLLPLIKSIGFDPIWFGVFVTVMSTVGLISPPVGLTVFVVQSQNPEVSLQTIFKGVMPFLYADILLLLALVVYPPIATWLPAVL
ncbi:MAG: TRAP transporter large permease [Betaproteobacteria bacterium]|nr:TRAP transporter large permease [Betaproteobacteria bacterium]NBY04205.1 TRAP transporter large permease [Betaproteobacteria bacterium]